MTEIHNSCSLGERERINRAFIHMKEVSGKDYVSGLGFETTKKECGLIGEVGSSIWTVTGHELLYVSGTLQGDDALSNITFHFDYGCG